MSANNNTTPNLPAMDPPPGFSVVRGNDGRDYLVPSYMVPAIEVALAAARHWQELRVDGAARGVCNSFFTSHCLY